MAKEREMLSEGKVANTVPVENMGHNVDNLAKRIEALEKDSHPPYDFSTLLADVEQLKRAVIALKAGQK